MPTVAACQIAVSDLDPQANTETVLKRLGALPASVELAVFPEYALTGFVADARVHASALDSAGAVFDSIEDAAEATDTGVVVGYLEAAGDDLYNALVYITPEGDRTVYRKRHLWDAEADVVTPGADRVVVDTPIGSTGLVTCYDLNFVSESAAFTDPPVDALVVAGAWPAEYAANWDLLLRARALDGVRWVIGVGRTGQRTTPGAQPTTYAGRSAIVRPDGSLTGRLGRGERSLVRTLDSSILHEQRQFIGSVD